MTQISKEDQTHELSVRNARQTAFCFFGRNRLLLASPSSAPPHVICRSASGYDATYSPSPAAPRTEKSPVIVFANTNTGDFSEDPEINLK